MKILPKKYKLAPHPEGWVLMKRVCLFFYNKVAAPDPVAETESGYHVYTYRVYKHKDEALDALDFALKHG